MKNSPGSSPPAFAKSATMAILVANILVFLYERTLPHAAQLAFQQRYALSLEGVLHGGVWQFFTYQFLHGGVTHLVFNLIFLHSFGPVMETTLGMKRYLGLYCWSGVFGGFVQLLAAWCSPGVIGDHPVVGASASLCGLLSALCALYSEEKLDIRLFFVIPVVLRAKFLLLVMAAISAGGILIRLGNVAHAAHLGGLLAGLIFLNLFRVEPLSGVADA